MLLLGHNLLSVFSNSALLSFGVNKVVSTSWPCDQIGECEQSREKPALLLLLRMEGSLLGGGARDAYAFRCIKSIVTVDRCMTHGMLDEAEGQL